MLNKAGVMENEAINSFNRSGVQECTPDHDEVSQQQVVRRQCKMNVTAGVLHLATAQRARPVRSGKLVGGWESSRWRMLSSKALKSKGGFKGYIGVMSLSM